MKKSELDELALELFDPDLPNVVSASISGGPDIYGSLSREFVETDEVVGVRSVFLTSSASVDGVRNGETIEVDGDTKKIRVIQPRGRAITALVLGQ